MTRLLLLYRYMKTMELMANILPTYIPQYNKALVNLLAEYNENKGYYSNYVELLECNKIAA